MDNTTQEKIKNFEQWNLDKTGHYKGSNLTKYGFPYLPGEYIPTDKRYSAFSQLSYALDVILLSNKVNVSCPVCGQKMSPVGVGVYPYDCNNKRLHPYDMIFEGCEGGHGGWYNSEIQS